MNSTLYLPKISSYAQLKETIASLEITKEAKELIIKDNLKSIQKSLQPAEIIKSTFHKLKNDPELGAETADMTLKLGADYLLGKLFKKSDTIGGYVKTIAAQQVVSFVLKKYDTQIHSFISGAKDKLSSFVSSLKQEEKSDDTTKE